YEEQRKLSARKDRRLKPIYTPLDGGSTHALGLLHLLPRLNAGDELTGICERGWFLRYVFLAISTRRRKP
ncbi:MAG: hypothetical protein LV473_14485, partial [Nitrospira sp.]|nr:hypothetical protein [Nitrospira sp.]